MNQLRSLRSARNVGRQYIGYYTAFQPYNNNRKNGWLNEELFVTLQKIWAK